MFILIGHVWLLGYELDLRLHSSGVRELSIANDNPTGTNRRIQLLIQ